MTATFPKRPEAPLPSLEIIAVRELAMLPQWVCWRFEERGGDQTKVPYQPNGMLAKSTNASTWSSYETCFAAAVKQGFDGIGFVFSESDPYVGVDLDDCIREDGTLEPWADEIVCQLDTYTEVSPSGLGLKLWCRAMLPTGRRKNAHVEMYETGRFFTATGKVWGDRETIEDRRAQILALHERVFGAESQAGSGDTSDRVADLAETLIVHRDAEPPVQKLEALLANHPAFRATWERRRTDLVKSTGGPDFSAYDLALASIVARAGWREQEIAALLVAFRRGWADPRVRAKGLRRRYVASTVEIATRNLTRAEPSSAEATAEPETPVEHLTDLGNAERLICAHGDDLRHVKLFGRWLVWDGTRFAMDDTGESTRRATAAVRSIYEEAARCTAADERKRIAAWAKASESAIRIGAMIQLAASNKHVAIRHERLDADPWLLNVQNGTIDLRACELRPHRRSDLLTKRVEALYDPDAEAPLWYEFLERIQPDPEVRSFLQRFTGYSLTGSTQEQKLAILWGGGANGKSTFVETVMALLGDYAQRTPAETLLARRESGIPNDVARLRGARFVAAVETEEGRRLAEVRVKELTGSDTISARFMRAEWFDFRPVAKLWISTNHRPTVRGTDEAIWRRICLIPFTVTIPEAERDRTLAERLRGELPGILAWAVEGCRAWLSVGLKPPAAVLAATSEYRQEQDVLGQFLDDACVADSGCWSPAGDLFKAYREWAEEAGEKHVLTQKAFGTALSERGFLKDRRGDSRTRGWRGIGILAARSRGEATA